MVVIGELFLGFDGELWVFLNVFVGGCSVGVSGFMWMLVFVH